MIKHQYWLVAVIVFQLGACAVTGDRLTPAPSETANNDLSTSAKTSIEEPLTRPFPPESFYDLLVAEFAVRAKQFDLALGNYIQQAHKTRDSAVTARATRLAQYVKSDKAGLDASLLWVDIEPENLEAQFTASTMLAKNDQPFEALKHMEIVLNNGGKTNFTAIAASALKQPKLNQEVLLIDIEKLIIKHPKYAQLYTSRAIIEQSLGNQEKALSSTRHAIKLDNFDIQAAVIETQLLQDMGRHDEAFIQLQKVLERNPLNRRLRLQYARILLKKDINEAQVQFERLLASTPEDPDLLVALSLINIELKRNDKAKSYLQRLLKTGHRNNESHYYLAQIAERESDIEEAIAHYQAIPFGKDYLSATNRIAELQAKQNQTKKARKTFSDGREKHPKLSLQLYLLEAELLLKLKQFEQCHILLSDALALHPQQANLLYMRFLISEKRNDMALMESDLRKLLQQDPNNATALNALGYILANRSEKLEEAYQFIQRALALKPNDPAILDSLGWVEYRRGNLEQSSALLKKAYKNYPDPEVAAHLGEVLWHQNQFEQAKQIWQQALDKHPHHPVVEETMQRMLTLSPQNEDEPSPVNQVLPQNKPEPTKPLEPATL